MLRVRTARKHSGWYVKTLPGGEAFRAKMNLIEDCKEQVSAVTDFFEALGERTDRMPAAVAPEEDEADMKTAGNLETLEAA